MALTKVSTDGVKDDAITKVKIPANQIEASELADNAVDTNAIADQAVALSKLPHGTSSNDGKFLRANNGADPTFETVTGTTINNNADNRLITGSGTANTLNGEANLVFNGNTLTHTVGANLHAIKSVAAGDHYTILEFDSNRASAGDSLSFINFKWNGDKVADIMAIAGSDTTNKDDGILAFRTSASQGSISEAMRIDSSGKVGIGTTSPAYKLHLNESTSGNNYVHFTNSSTGTSGSDGAQVGIDGNERLILWQAENNDIRFATNNTERMRLLAGGGLTFNGDTAAANALDDYEEGTWTPTQGNFSTFSLSSGQFNATYTKIGNIVHFRFEQTGGELAWSQAQYIGGLPFTVAKNGAGTWTNNYPNSGGEMLIYSSNILYFSQTDGYNTSSYKLVFSGTYETNQ